MHKIKDLNTISKKKFENDVQKYQRALIKQDGKILFEIHRTPNRDNIYIASIDLIKLLAHGNNSYALRILSFCYKRGIGVEQNHELALKYVKLQDIYENKLKYPQKNEHFSKFIIEEYLKLQKKCDDLEKENLEFKLRPPPSGGIEYQKALNRFNENKNSQ